MLNAEYRAEVLSFWSELGLVLLALLAAFLLGVVVTAPLFFSL